MRDNGVGEAGDNRPRQREGDVDVLIIVGTKDEFDAVRANVGLKRWTEHGVGGPAPYCTAEIRTARGQTLLVALARPTTMGGRGTGPIATTLTDLLRPRCLAMCGVCAGNPGATAPGDVVVAAPAYEWDEGKHTADVFHAAPQQFPLDIRWIRAAQDFDPTSLPSHGMATDEEAELWYLERLYKGQDPRTHPARQRYFPQSTWRTRLERLESGGFITWAAAGPVLTDAGSERIQRTLYVDVDGPQRLPFAVFAGPMASGNAVMSDPKIWDWLGFAQRKLLALDMEAATIATVAHERQVPHCLIAKGVMDHADLDKDDRFKAFAANASAEVLFALLGELLSPAATRPDIGRTDLG
jgi:nucleoside phosphorylase